MYNKKHSEKAPRLFLHCYTNTILAICQTLQWRVSNETTFVYFTEAFYEVSFERYKVKIERNLRIQTFHSFFCIPLIPSWYFQ